MHYFGSFWKLAVGMSDNSHQTALVHVTEKKILTKIEGHSVYSVWFTKKMW